MNIQSKVEVSQGLSQLKKTALPSGSSRTRTTKAMITVEETTKTGLWISRPQGRILSCPTS